MDSKRLETYADLIVNTGINPDPGQDVVITAGFDQLDFVRMVTEKCYNRGVGKVWFNWVDMPLEKLHYLYQSEERLSKFENWEVEKLRWQSEKLPARLWLDSDDPDGMDGIDPEKRAKAQILTYILLLPQSLKHTLPNWPQMENTLLKLNGFFFFFKCSSAWPS